MVGMRTATECKLAWKNNFLPALLHPAKEKWNRDELLKLTQLNTEALNLDWELLSTKLKVCNYCTYVDVSIVTQNGDLAWSNGFWVLWKVSKWS